MTWGHSEGLRRFITPPYVAHMRLLCACASSQVKLSVCCTECLGWGHDRLSYNPSPLIILIHITPGHETSRCCQQHCVMLLPQSYLYSKRHVHNQNVLSRFYAFIKLMNILCYAFIVYSNWGKYLDWSNTVTPHNFLPPAHGNKWWRKRYFLSKLRIETEYSLCFRVDWAALTDGLSEREWGWSELTLT